MVAYNNKKYYIDIIETKPSNAISIIETDCEVDFAPPLDYKEPEKPVASVPKGKAQAEGATFLNYYFVFYFCYIFLYPRVVIFNVTIEFSMHRRFSYPAIHSYLNA